MPNITQQPRHVGKLLNVLSERRQKILFFLSGLDNYVTSQKIAEFLSVSDRTVKKEINELPQAGVDMGFFISAKRGCGYRLEILDHERFAPIKEQLDIRFTGRNYSKEKKADKTGEIIRLLLAVEDYIKLDDIAETMYVARGSIKAELRKIREIFSFFGLSVLSKTGRGIKIEGTELNRRLCMVEFYEFHYLDAEPNFDNNRFLTSFQTARKEEKTEIRKIFLDTLRRSNIRIVDMYVNRIFRYLILMKNRFDEGKHVDIPKKDMFILEKITEYQVAKEVLRNLQVFGGYCVDENETMALALLMLIWLDLSEFDDIRARFPFCYDETLACCESIRRAFLEIWGVDLGEFKNYPLILSSALIPIIIQKSFKHLLSHRFLGEHIRGNLIKYSPLAVNMACTIADIFEESTGFVVHDMRVSQIAVRLYALIDSVEYDYMPRKLIVTSRNGFQAAHIIRSRILRHWGEKYFKTIDVYDYYEIRGLEQEAYDYVILNFPDYSYKYDIPYVYVSQIPDGAQLEEIFEKVILSGYNLERAALPILEKNAGFYGSFECASQGTFAKMISYKCSVNASVTASLEGKIFRCRELQIVNRVAVIIVDGKWTNREYMEIFRLRKNLFWCNEEVAYILFISVDFGRSLKKVRYLENLTRELVSHPGLIDDLLRNAKDLTFGDIVRTSLKSG